jgi:hypothetical protein
MSLLPLPPGHPAAIGMPMPGIFSPQQQGAPESVYGITPQMVPQSAWPTSMRVMDALGGLFGAQSPQQASLFGVDPQEARRRSLMAAGMQMLAASGPSTTKQSAGQILSQGYLAGQKANDEYAQDAQRRAYLAQLAEQQRNALEQQKRLQQLEAARGKKMAGAQYTPEALERTAGELYASGDVAGAEGALEMAQKLRDHQVSSFNAETNRRIADRGANQYDFIEGPNGIYRTDPRTGEATQAASWPQFNPNIGQGGQAQATDQEAAIIKDQLKGQLSSLISWAENDGGKVMGSPKAGAAWDATVGRMFGTEDYQNRRAMGMITGRQLLDMAKYLKPMSNTDILFLERTMPLQDDAPELWAKWMREYAKRAQIDLGGGSSVYDKYQLTRPDGKPARGASGSF